MSWIIGLVAVLVAGFGYLVIRGGDQELPEYMQDEVEIRRRNLQRPRNTKDDAA